MDFSSSCSRRRCVLLRASVTSFAAVKRDESFCDRAEADFGRCGRVGEDRFESGDVEGGVGCSSNAASRDFLY